MRARRVLRCLTGYQLNVCPQTFHAQPCHLRGQTWILFARLFFFNEHHLFIQIYSFPLREHKRVTTAAGRSSCFWCRSSTSLSLSFLLRSLSNIHTSQPTQWLIIYYEVLTHRLWASLTEHFKAVMRKQGCSFDFFFKHFNNLRKPRGHQLCSSTLSVHPHVKFDPGAAEKHGCVRRKYVPFSRTPGHSASISWGKKRSMQGWL